jgi:hypothetical protein
MPSIRVLMRHCPSALCAVRPRSSVSRPAFSGCPPKPGFLGALTQSTTCCARRPPVHWAPGLPPAICGGQAWQCVDGSTGGDCLDCVSAGRLPGRAAAAWRAPVQWAGAGARVPAPGDAGQRRPHCSGLGWLLAVTWPLELPAVGCWVAAGASHALVLGAAGLAPGD